MPLDPRLEALRASLPTTVDLTRSAAERREEILARQEGTRGLLVTPGPDLHEVRDLVVPAEGHGVPVRVYRPREGLLPGLLYIHGGGWWQGSVDDTDPACRHRALDVDCVVVSVEYRLAPEDPFPAGLDDCWAVARWMHDNAEELGIDVSRLALSGGSAGGNLAAAVTLLARDAGGPHFLAQVLEVPGMDLVFDDDSVAEYGDGYGFTKELLAECVEFYIGDRDPRQPLVSPLYAELHDLPPALVLTAECDPIRGGGEAYADKLTAAGVPVQRRRYDGMAHGCMEMDVLLPDVAEDYRATITDFLRRAFASVPASL